MLRVASRREEARLRICFMKRLPRRCRRCQLKMSDFATLTPPAALLSLEVRAFWGFAHARRPSTGFIPRYGGISLPSLVPLSTSVARASARLDHGVADGDRAIFTRSRSRPPAS